MTRPRVDMTPETFAAALRWAAGQDELILSGTGESLLNPACVDMLGDARAALGDDARITLVTNGFLVDEAMAARLAPHRPFVIVSLHVPSKAAVAVQALSRHGILGYFAIDAVTDPFNWAGQIDWPQTPRRYPCKSLHEQCASVSSTGDILACCFDVTAESCVGSVLEGPHDVTLRPWRCCKDCNQDLPVL